MKTRKSILVAAIVILAAAIIIIALLLMKNPGKNKEEPITHSPYPAVGQAADNADPTGAVVGLLNALRDWDMGLAAQWMSQVEDGGFSDAYNGILAPMMKRMEFETGAERITGSTAIVDVSVYAVDIGGALGDLTANAAGYMLHCSLTSEEPDWPDFLEGYIGKLEVDSLIRVKRTASAYLVQDAGGKWRLDTSNTDNREFCNAVTGGLVDVAEALSRMASATTV